MDVSLVMFKSDGTRRDFPVTKRRVVVGRKNDCDLRIPLTSVSRQHCEIEMSDGQLKLRDLGSSNGTYHNSNRVQETALEAGDEIIVGPVVFTVVVDGEPAEIKPVRTIIDQGADEEAVVESGGDRAADSATTLGDEDIEVPAEVEPEEHTPTVDLDDPISALEALEQLDDDDDARGDKAHDADDSGELQIIDDEDENKNSP